MGLQTYESKRDFRKTPEPAPRKISKKQSYSFCVQKHDATRLHYDFRLELDGVLKSWAVTKGPSLNPADKRLAVEVEDHPLDYGGFEGTIPKGQYGGGTVMLWDRGTWKPIGDPHEGLKKGNLKFELQGERMKGKWALIRMRNKDERDKHNNWLLIKERDDESDTGRRAEHFLDDNAYSVKTGSTMDEIADKSGGAVWGSNKKPAKKAVKKNGKKIAELQRLYPQVQLATLVTEQPLGSDWVHEIKFDGYRIQCFVAQGEVKIMTRNGNDWTDRFPAIARALSELEIDDAVLDGEAVVLDAKGHTSFQALQNALGDGGDPARIKVFFFDLLHLDGQDLAKKPLHERKAALERLLLDAPKRGPLFYSEHLEGSDAALEGACKMGLEGLVSKKINAPYSAGRGRSWLKSKCSKRQEFVIIGFTAAKNDHRAIGALQLGYMKEGHLAYAGKVGTGFSHKMAEKIYDELKPLISDSTEVADIPKLARRGTVWVRPQVLCEITFTEWTSDGHLRHPSFEGLREDKAPEEVVREKPVKTEKVVEKAGRRKTEKKEVFVLGVNITHPERIVFEGQNISKGQLAEYYAAVAPYMLKEIKGRPISLLRCPGGADAECFFQRNPDDYMKTVVKPFKWSHNENPHEYLYIEDEKGLVFLIQMGAIEIHPWGARVDSIEYPRRIIFDLDPDEAVPFEAVKLAALDLRKRLKAMGLESFLRVTGGKGLHILVPLDGRAKWPVVKDFAQNLAEQMVREVPEAYVATMAKTKRKGKIFIDYFRNDYTATAIADYSVRARPGAPVAVPIEWKELKGLKTAHEFTIGTVLARLKKKKLDDGRHTLRQSLPAKEP